MPNIHPLIVHFPIALLTIGIVFDVLGLLSKNNELSRVGWWMQVAGTFGLMAAVVTGLLAQQTVVISAAAHDAFEHHEQIAFIVSAVFAALLLWRIASRTQLPQRYRILFLLLFLFGLVVMWLGAWYGGEMVYRFGVGGHSIQR
jgi:uncharacterized membrane protein